MTNIVYRTLYVTKLATVQNFEIMFIKNNMVEIFYIRNHVQQSCLEIRHWILSILIYSLFFFFCNLNLFFL